MVRKNNLLEMVREDHLQEMDRYKIFRIAWDFLNRNRISNTNKDLTIVMEVMSNREIQDKDKTSITQCDQLVL